MAKLTCLNFEDQIHARLDDRLPLGSDRELKCHAAQCDHCQELLRTYLSLEQTLVSAFPQPSHGEMESSQLPCPARFEDVSSRQNARPVMWLVGLAALFFAILLMPVWFANPVNSDVEIAKNSVVVSTVQRGQEPRTLEYGEIANVPSFDLNVDALHLQIASLEQVQIPESLRNAYEYASGIPSVRSFECSVNATIEMIQRSFNADPGQEPKDPDLGLHMFSANMEALV